MVWLGHSTVAIELDGVRLLTDPVLRRGVLHLRRRVPLDLGAAASVDAVLVSHGHWDHLDAKSLALVGRAVPVVVPAGLGPLLRRRGFEDVRELDVGGTVDVGGVRVRATQAEHDGSRGPFGIRADTLGWAVDGSSSVWFAGDTDLFAGMADLGPLDLALLPVAGWGPRLPPGHLDAARAAEALALLRPRVAVPIHWGTYAVAGRRTSSAPAEEFRRQAARLAPEVDVRILAVGEALEVASVPQGPTVIQ